MTGRITCLVPVRAILPPPLFTLGMLAGIVGGFLLLILAA